MGETDKTQEEMKWGLTYFLALPPVDGADVHVLDRFTQFS